MLAAIDRTIEAALAHGKHVGAAASSAKELQSFIARGLRYIAWQSDMTMYKNALKAAAAELASYRNGA